MFGLNWHEHQKVTVVGTSTSQIAHGTGGDHYQQMTIIDLWKT